MTTLKTKHINTKYVKTDFAGSHCEDIPAADNTSDSDWLVEQRKTEVNVIEG